MEQDSTASEVALLKALVRILPTIQHYPSDVDLVRVFAEASGRPRHVYGATGWDLTQHQSMQVSPR
ncbi:MAG: hypothetical protein ACRDRX_12700 [Pseudonocardiaceae bacterium]